MNFLAESQHGTEISTVHFWKEQGFLLGQAIGALKKVSTIFKIESAFGYKWLRLRRHGDILFPNTPKTEEHRGLDDAKMENMALFMNSLKVYQPFLITSP